MPASSSAASPVCLAVPVAVLAAVLGASLTACGTDAEGAQAAPSAPSAASAASAPARSTVPVSVDDCGAGWSPTAAGRQTLVLHNPGARPADARVVALDGGRPGKIYAEVQPLGPGTDVAVHVRLGAGTYALQCTTADQLSRLGPRVTLAGPATGGPGVAPVDAYAMTLAAWQYQSWVVGRLPALVRETRTLASELRAGDQGAARASWLAAHLDYQRLGAAYDAFGELDGAIDGLPAGLAGGVHDPGFTGFHRIEVGLFAGAAPAGLARYADGVVRDVRSLQGQLGATRIDARTVAIRAHEISENLLQTSLTGDDDLGSHSDLATLGAGLDGTAEVLALVRDQLAPRYPRLRSLTRALVSTRALVRTSLARPWARRPVATWPLAQREQLSAAVADLCERLAPVADVLEPRTGGS